MRINSSSLSGIYDKLKDGGSWWVIEGGSVFSIRPSVSIAATVGLYDRDGTTVPRVALSSSYRYSHRLSGLYELSLSYPEEFLPLISQKVVVNYLLRKPFSIESGLMAAKYENGWVRLGTLGGEASFRSLALKYQILAGLDNNNETIIAQIAALTYFMSETARISVGGSTGNETVDRLTQMTSDKIVTLYSVLSFPVNLKLSSSVSIAEEWRNSEAFRTTFSLSFNWKY
jgi:hypothetical protein